MATNLNDMRSPSPSGHATVGAHYARPVGFAYMGVHERQAYKGTPKPPCGKIILTFELLDDFGEFDGVQKPRWVSKKENAFSSDNSNLTKIYKKLDPAGKYQGDFAALVTAAESCLINIEQKTSNGVAIEGTRIGDISQHPPLQPGQTLPALQNPTFVFDFDNPTLESWGSLKPWMQQMAQEAQDYPGSECEKVAKAYEAQQAAAQAAQPEQPAPAAQAQAPAQQAPVASVAQPAPVQTPAQQAASPGPVGLAVPPAPPGFRYDPATGGYVPDAQPAGQPAPPAGGTPY